MINLIVNDEAVVFHQQTLSELLCIRQPAKPFAVAINTVFIPKGCYQETVLQEGDRIDIVSPVVGG